MKSRSRSSWISAQLEKVSWISAPGSSRGSPTWGPAFGCTGYMMSLRFYRLIQGRVKDEP